MSDDLRNFLNKAKAIQADMDQLGVSKPAAQPPPIGNPPGAAVLDAMDRLFNALVGIFDNDANNMPNGLRDDYIAARGWVDAQPVGWKKQRDGE